MRVLGVVGWSGAGKTTLIERVLPRLIAGGLRVSTVKHAHHGASIDQPGKDSDRHRLAGAQEVLLVTGARWALLHEGGPPPLPALLARLQPADLVLVEGFKAETLPKLEVFRAVLGKPALWPDRPEIVAVATTGALGEIGRPVLPLGDTEAVAAWIAGWVADWQADWRLLGGDGGPEQPRSAADPGAEPTPATP